MRLDWLMWFEAMAPSPQSDWFFDLLAKLLQGDAGVLGLLRTNPFPGCLRTMSVRRSTGIDSPRPSERRVSGAWWSRQLVGTFYGPVSLGRE